MSIRHSVVAAVAAAVASSGALSGCSEADSEPPDSGLPAESELTDSPTAPSPTESSSTGSTPSGPREPRLPAAAKAPGKAGAKAFVAYYIRLLNYASHTGETASLKRYGEACRHCMAFIRLAESTYEDGGWFEGGTWTPVPSSWFVLRSNPGYLVGLNLDVAASRQRLQQGGHVKRYRAEQIGRDFRVVLDGKNWSVISMKEPL